MPESEVNQADVIVPPDRLAPEDSKLNVFEFLKTAEVGTTRFKALNDFLNRDELSRNLTTIRQQLAGSNEAPNQQDPVTRSDLESNMRVEEVALGGLKAQMIDKQGSIPGYQGDLNTLEGLRFQLEQELINVSSKDEKDARNEAIQVFNEARELIFSNNPAELIKRTEGLASKLQAERELAASKLQAERELIAENLSSESKSKARKALQDIGLTLDAGSNTETLRNSLKFLESHLEGFKVETNPKTGEAFFVLSSASGNRYEDFVIGNNMTLYWRIAEVLGWPRTDTTHLYSLIISKDRETGESQQVLKHDLQYEPGKGPYVEELHNYTFDKDGIEDANYEDSENGDPVMRRVSLNDTPINFFMPIE